MLAVAVMQALDAITLSVIQAALQQVCDEMDLTFSRAAFSPVIAEANDRSDGIYSAVDGSLIAQGSQGLPVFVGVMQYSTRTIIEMIAAGAACRRKRATSISSTTPISAAPI
jgi:N-methylhydantoinase B